MNGMHTDTTAGSTLVAEDTRLRCPECDYNLTGLTSPRCPECGSTFDWDEVRQARDRAPRIAFERARGWRKTGGFFVTWATVLFAPWIFARQITSAVSLRIALVFGLICFLPVTARYVVGAANDWASYFAWILTAGVYVSSQATLMVILDPSGWREPRETFCFWLAVGGYTTAIVVTEVWAAAPLVAFSELVEWFQEGLAGNVRVLGVNGWSGLGWPGWIQIVLWLCGLACVYCQRLRQRRISIAKLLLAVPATLLLLLMLYAVCVEYVGVAFFYEIVFDGSF